jgi:hypothetical protein
VLEVHAEDACQQRQEKEDSRYDREHTKLTVRLFTDFFDLLLTQLSYPLVIELHAASECMSTRNRDLDTGVMAQRSSAPELLSRSMGNTCV